MFDEVNDYRRIKFAEYEQKKIPYTEQLRIKTEASEALAAKYAVIAAARTSAEGKRYISRNAHWVAENMDGTAAALIRIGHR